MLKIKTIPGCIALLLLLSPCLSRAQHPDTLYLQNMNRSEVNDLYKTHPALRTSGTATKRPLIVAGKTYNNGIAALEGLMAIDLKGVAESFEGTFASLLARCEPGLGHKSGGYRAFRATLWVRHGLGLECLEI